MHPFFFFFSQILEIAASMMDLLAATKHRGAFEQVGIGCSIGIYVYCIYVQVTIDTVCPGSSDIQKKYLMHLHQKMRFTPFVNYIAIL